MNFAKHLLTAAAIVAACSAHAASVTVHTGQPAVLVDDVRGNASTGRRIEINMLSTAGAMYLSNGRPELTTAAPKHLSSLGGTVLALNVMRSLVTSVGNSEVIQENRSVGNINRSIRSVVNVSTPITGISTDTTSGKLVSLNTSGGAKISAEAAPDIGQGGGEFTFRDLAVDFNTKTISATLLSTPLAIDGTLGQTEYYSGAVWTFDGWTGPTSLPLKELIEAIDGRPSALSGLGYELLGRDHHGINFKGIFEIDLKMTENALAVFDRALVLTEGQTSQSTFHSSNSAVRGWGVLRYEIVFSADDAILTPSIPEPGTYSMFGVGLIGVLAITRGQRKRLSTGAMI